MKISTALLICFFLIGFEGEDLLAATTQNKKAKVLKNTNQKAKKNRQKMDLGTQSTLGGKFPVAKAKAIPSPTPQSKSTPAPSANPEVADRPDTDSHPIKKQLVFGGLEFSFLRLDTEEKTGAKATFVSKYDVGVPLRAGYNLSSKFEVGALFNGRLLQLESPSGFTAAKDANFFLGFGIAGKYKIDEYRSIGLTFLREQEPFVRAISGSQYTIDSVNVYKAKAGISFVIARVKSGPIFLNLDGIAYLPSDGLGYKINSGSGFSPSLLFKSWLVGGHIAELYLNYSTMNKNTELFNLAEQRITLGAGATW